MFNHLFSIMQIDIQSGFNVAVFQQRLYILIIFNRYYSVSDSKREIEFTKEESAFFIKVIGMENQLVDMKSVYFRGY